MKSHELLKRHHVFHASNNIRSILILFALIWIVWIPYTLFDIVYYNFGFPPSEFYAFYIVLAALGFGIALLGFKINSQTIHSVTIKDSKSISDEMTTLAEEFTLKMERHKYFLDPDLDLRSFSSTFDLHPNKVSATCQPIPFVKNNFVVSS